MTGTYEFDIALSFAGEQRDYVNEVAERLRGRAKVFYDQDASVELWGKDLATFLTELYRAKARYCVMFISKQYRDKMWTNVERKAALCAAAERLGSEYVLPVRFDDTDLPGLLPTIGYLSAAKTSPEKLAEAIVEKLRGSAVPAPARPTLSTEAEHELADDLVHGIPVKRERARSALRDQLGAVGALPPTAERAAILAVTQSRISDDEKAEFVDLLVDARSTAGAREIVTGLVLVWDPAFDLSGSRLSDALGRYFGRSDANLLTLLGTLSLWIDRLPRLAPYRAHALLTAVETALGLTPLPVDAVLESMGNVCERLTQHPDDNTRSRAARLLGKLRG